MPRSEEGISGRLGHAPADQGLAADPRSTRAASWPGHVGYSRAGRLRSGIPTKPLIYGGMTRCPGCPWGCVEWAGPVNPDLRYLAGLRPKDVPMSGDVRDNAGQPKPAHHAPGPSG